MDRLPEVPGIFDLLHPGHVSHLLTNDGKKSSGSFVGFFFRFPGDLDLFVW